MGNSKYQSNEIDSATSHALISWRSIVAGLLVTMFVMMGLLGLGLAIGGIGLSENTTMRSVSFFTGFWFLGSSVLSLFIGSYFAARISKFRKGRIGSAQGLVIASLFLSFFLYQVFSTVQSVGSMATNFLGKTGELVTESSNVLNNLTENSLSDLTLRSSRFDVVQGLTTRLMRGDSIGAKNYLASEAGISPIEADVRIVQMKNQLDRVIVETKEATAVALRSTGWSLFMLVILGGLAALGGGAVGSVVNFRNPLIRQSDDTYPLGHQV